jgi:HD-GYP domain-containing protein (c-di-GMP phosphodiesterase class II)
MRKINPGTLAVGKPLLFDYFDAEGALLLKRGNTLHSQRQLEELLERGLFEKTEETVSKASAAPVPHLTNPFDLLDRCKSRLVPLLNQVRIDDPALIPDSANIEAIKAEYRNNVAMRCAASTAQQVMPDGLPTRILEIAKVIQKTCRLDADATLGYVHLSLEERYTAIHPLHCAILAEVLSSALNIEQDKRQAIIAATLTANISILNLQERLHKQESELSTAQRDLLQLHPALSREMLIASGVSDEAWLEAVLLHHERFDGSGYPFAMVGDAIPITARIVALTDIYDAMIKPRGYRKAVGSKMALREIFLKRGGKVDENLAKALIKELGLYPPGSFVRLQNGEIAIVFRRGKMATTPLVRSVIGPRGAMLDRPVRRDTSETHHVIVDLAPYDPSVRISFNQLWDYDKD